ncbi:amidohydrolase family protein [Parvularcula flava]|uniref:Amidohydrolase family protein n=1 Tax=Aquisalinus luteolus TaxID=1566827 RepID=A0A8J3A9I6_9PROT|nr:amidohydrolase family protein [Aquisalinus luteolus]NHK29109.1 amidohydrolase family protein [Aquisalinus luteolus]GGI00278.1 Xaa-Pro dipeptidase [Aquisalinus luteolus]
MKKIFKSTGAIMAIIGLMTGAQAGAQTTLVKAARYLDMDSGRYVSPATVLVENGRIASLSPSAEQVNNADETIDLGGRTLLPGFIDMHTHLAYDIGTDWVTEPVRWTEADFALRGASNAKKTLEAGFTTVRELGSPMNVSSSLDEAANRGLIVAPRIFAANSSLSVTGGHCDVTGFAPGILEGDVKSGLADGADEFLKATRYQIKHGAKVIKVCATAGVLSFEATLGAQQMTMEEMRAVVEEAERHGVRVAAHAHGTEGIIAASEAGIHSIEHASIITDEAARVLKANGTYIVPTLYLSESIDYDALPAPIRKKAEDVMPMMDESFRVAMRRGVKIAFGTDAGVYPHGDNAKEFAYRVNLGQSEIEALRSATTYAADLLGVSDRGLIAQGRYADIVAVDGDPLEDITTTETVSFVMKGGTVFVAP